MDAVNLQLSLESAAFVGAENEILPQEIFFIGYEGFLGVAEIETVSVWEGTTVLLPGNDWLRPSMSDLLAYGVDERVYADFTVVPEPGTALLLGLGLAGLVILFTSGRLRGRSVGP